MESKLAGVQARDDGLEVTWHDCASASFPWFWLRDHGENEASLDPATLQRRVDTFAIPEDIRGVDAQLIGEGEGLRVVWSDNSPPSEFSARLLEAMAGYGPPAPKPRLWSAGSMPEPLPSVGFARLMESDEGVRDWLGNIRDHGFSMVSDVPASEAGTRKLAERMGYVRETIFGGLWKLSAEVEDHGDTAYTTQYLEPHTDATYCHDAPGLQMFNCVEFDGRGGESVLVDGFAIAEALRRERPADFEVLCATPVPGRYIEPGVHLRAERPAIRLGRNGAVEQVSFNNYDRAPFLLEPEQMRAFYRAYGELHRRIVDQAGWLKIPLRPGMALIFDNWRLLHGRMGYTGKRVFYGCYHNREDFESRLRVSGLAA